jgi:hypothetical protein
MKCKNIKTDKNLINVVCSKNDPYSLDFNYHEVKIPVRLNSNYLNREDVHTIKVFKNLGLMYTGKYKCFFIFLIKNS